MNSSLYQKYLNVLTEEEILDFLKKYLEVPALIRLKKIGYFCGMDYASKDVYQFKEKITRFDHSLTTALLTWRFTKSKKATLAALFHDISTPCFAHVIDYMNKDYENQESTEEYTKSILEHDELLYSYLKQDGITIDEIADFKKYSIVDNDRPRLCADRFDGIILTGISWTKEVGEKEIEEFVGDLTVYKNELKEEELGFKTKNTARKVLEVSNNIDLFCHSNEDNYMMDLLASITRKAIENKVVTYDELYVLDEEELIQRISSCQNEELRELLKKFQNIQISEIPVVKLDGIKVRDLDPLVENQRLKTMLENEKIEQEVQKIIENLKEPMEYLNEIMKKQLRNIRQEVDFLIESQNTNQDRIEHTFDILLELAFWFGNIIEPTYYKLLRYYQNINLEASVDYEKFYLEEILEEDPKQELSLEELKEENESKRKGPKNL